MPANQIQITADKHVRLVIDETGAISIRMPGVKINLRCKEKLARELADRIITDREAAIRQAVLVERKRTAWAQLKALLASGKVYFPTVNGVEHLRPR